MTERGDIECVHFLTSIRIRKTRSGSATAMATYIPNHKEWQGWQLRQAKGASFLVLTDPKGREYEVPRTNCVIVRAPRGE